MRRRARVRCADEQAAFAAAGGLGPVERSPRLHKSLPAAGAQRLEPRCPFPPLLPPHALGSGQRRRVLDGRPCERLCAQRPQLPGDTFQYQRQALLHPTIHTPLAAVQGVSGLDAGEEEGIVDCR